MWKYIIFILLMGCEDHEDRSLLPKATDRKGDLALGFGKGEVSHELWLFRSYLNLLEAAKKIGDDEGVNYYSEKLAWLLVASSSYSELSVKREIASEINKLPDWVRGIPVSGMVLFPEEYELALMNVVNAEGGAAGASGFGKRVPTVEGGERRVLESIIDEFVSRSQQ